MYRDRDAQRRRACDRSTIAVTAGRPRGPGAPLNHRPCLPPPSRRATGVGYARRSNPTWESFEEALGALEGGTAVAFGSGMAAATAVVDLLEPGARVAVAGDAYVEVRRLLDERRAAACIEVETVDALDTAAVIDALDASMRSGSTRSPIRGSTFRSSTDRPRPRAAAAHDGRRLDAGDARAAAADRTRRLVVIHSATKYIGGHSDLVLGAAVARDPRVAAAPPRAPRRQRLGAGHDGGMAGPARAQNAAAANRARATQRRADRRPPRAHDAVERVRYPGLAADPGARDGARLLDAPGAIVSFEVADADRADRVCDRLEVITHASSLGGVETLIDRQSRWHAEAAVAERPAASQRWLRGPGGSVARPRPCARRA